MHSYNFVGITFKIYCHNKFQIDNIRLLNIETMLSIRVQKLFILPN